LNGDVSLTDFASAMQNFKSLIDTLSEEVASSVGIEWIVEDLNAGNASII